MLTSSLAGLAKMTIVLAGLKDMAQCLTGNNYESPYKFNDALY